MGLAGLGSSRPLVFWQLAALLFSLSPERCSSQADSAEPASGLEIQACVQNLEGTGIISADLFSDLDSCSDRGVLNYGVSMTTLEDVFLRLKDGATMDREGTMVSANTQSAAEEQGYLAVTPGHASNNWLLGSSYFFTRYNIEVGLGHKCTCGKLSADEHVPGEERAEAGPQCPDETEPDSLLLSGAGKVTVSGLALWRQQVSTVAWVHLLKLKSSVKNLQSM